MIMRAGCGSGWSTAVLADPGRDVSDDRWVDVLGWLVLGGRGRSRSGEEQVVVRLVHADCDIRPVSQCGPPPGQVVGHGDLVVAAALEDEHGLVQRCRSRGRVVTAYVQ